MKRPRFDVDQEKVVSRLKDLGDKVRQEATELSSRVRSEASRTWKISNLRLEIGLLGRKRRRRLAELGELAYGLMRDGKLEASALVSLYGEIEAIDSEVAEKESRVESLEGEARLERDQRRERRAARAGRAKRSETDEGGPRASRKSARPATRKSATKKKSGGSGSA